METNQGKTRRPPTGGAGFQNSEVQTMSDTDSDAAKGAGRDTGGAWVPPQGAPGQPPPPGYWSPPQGEPGQPSQGEPGQAPPGGPWVPPQGAPGQPVSLAPSAVLGVVIAFVLRGAGGGRAGSSAAQGDLFLEAEEPTSCRAVPTAL